jgi:uncharacterized membrane protein YvbJ
MKRCKDCGHEVEDTDQVCTACRLAEWRHFERHAQQARRRQEALDANRQAHNARRRNIDGAIKAGIITAVSVMLFLALVSATRDAMRYEYVTKPAMLKANGVR